MTKRDVSALADLLARVKGATGADREIDFWITVLLWDPDPTDDIAALKADIALVSIEEMYVEKPFTASLDAALALIERVLPGWRVRLDQHDQWMAAILRPGKVEGLAGYSAWAPTPALALLAAGLQALISEPNPDETAGTSTSTAGKGERR